MIFALLFGYLGYKKAKESGRNGLLWGIAALVAFIGVQMLVWLLVGIALGFGEEAFGWSESLIYDYEVIINIFAVFGGFTSGFLILWYLGRTPATTDRIEQKPPPPPTFDK